jgi:hypothetical protein
MAQKPGRECSMSSPFSNIVLGEGSDDHEQEHRTALDMVLLEAERVLAREIILAEAERVACVLWVAHTFIYECFQLTPRLFITSEVAGSGKTELMKRLKEMASGGKYFTRATEAALGRLKTAEGAHLTVLLDQLDNALDTKEASTGPMLDTLISGADCGSSRLLTEKIRETYKPIELDFGYPMALAKIGGLPSPALMSRCIVIHMRQATSAESRRLYRQEATPSEMLVSIRNRLANALNGQGNTLANARPGMPEGLHNRMRDKWRPLVAIADFAGGDWPLRGRQAAIELELDEQDEEEAAHILLLRRVVAVLKGWPHEAIFSEELDGRLGANMSAKKRGRLLTAVGLKAKNVRREERQAKGYLVEEIRDRARQYLPDRDG